MKTILTLILFCMCGRMQMQAQSSPEISKFPVSNLNKNGTKQLVIYLTGDGGINTFSQQVCDELALKNYPVLRFDSRKYFWKQKTPEQFAQDLGEIIKYYLVACNKTEFSVVGYSFGADAALLAIPRLPANLKQKLKSSVFLSPAVATDLSVRITDLLGFENNKGRYKTLPEIDKITGRVFCIFGKDEDSPFYKSVKDKKNIGKILVPGSHRYNNNPVIVAAAIREALN